MSEHCDGCEGCRNRHSSMVACSSNCRCPGLSPAVDAVALMREAARIIDLYAGTYQARAYGCAARLRKAADELEGRRKE